MPDTLKTQEVEKGIDPTVNNQFDDKTGTDEKFEDFYAIADKLKIGLMGTLRNGIGPVARSMAVAKRSGPDFLFLSNKDSQKFDDIEKNKVCNIYFQNSNTQDWISVTGEAVASSNTDSRIKEVYNKSVAAWFGDLGDGVHTGGPEDPRMALIEVRAKYVSYWKHDVSTLGFAAEVASATFTGKVANTGTLRHMKEDEIAHARKNHSELTK